MLKEIHISRSIIKMRTYKRFLNFTIFVTGKKVIIKQNDVKRV